METKKGRPSKFGKPMRPATRVQDYRYREKRKMMDAIGNWGEAETKTLTKMLHEYVMKNAREKDGQMAIAQKSMIKQIINELKKRYVDAPIT